MSGEKENLSDKPLHALEEQLARQKAILANKALVRKLPDKGSKIQTTVTKLEAEIERKRKEAAVKKAQMSHREVEELEWALGSIPFLRDQLRKLKSASPSDVQEEAKPEPEPDTDDEEGENADELNPNPLKIIARSQISQRQAKTVISAEASSSSSAEKMDVSTGGGGDAELDRFTNRLVKTDLKKPKEDTKYRPSKSLKTRAPGSSSPAPSVTSLSSNTSSQGEKSGKKKYDECLLPPGHHGLEPAIHLSMEETIKIENEKVKHAETLKSLAPPKKVYAYDKLREQGLLGSYSVEMQTTRPVNPDMDDEDLNQEDDLFSDGQITEESDSDDDVEEVQASNQKTSKDLSNLVNASLKLK